MSNNAAMRWGSTWESTWDPEGGTPSEWFRFTDHMWLRLVRCFGDKHGLGSLAQQIAADGSISDLGTRQRILDLREDRKINLALAKELALHNARDGELK